MPADNEHPVVNIGPSHPAMHGCFRVQAVMDGETIQDCEAEIGYMHRNFEKMAENRTYWQIIPYTDRLNYCSSFMNGHGWALAVEKLMGVPAPPRAEAIRVILSELSRIMDHFVCIGTNIVDLGAITPFFVLFRAREDIYDLLESCCGARLTVSYVRIGGLAADVPDDFVPRCRAVMKSIVDVTNQADKLLTRNSIFTRRFKDVGALSADDALSYGWVGPCLRASGVPYDIRRDHPYSGYEQYDFDVPVGTAGDCYDRYLVRMEEIRQSLRIIDQALQKLPGGAGDRGRQARGPPAEVRRLQQHRSADEPLQARLRGDPRPAGRGVRLHRGGQRRARVLHRERRPQASVAGEGAAAVLQHLPGVPADDQGASPAPTRWRSSAGSTSSPASWTGNAEDQDRREGDRGRGGDVRDPGRVAARDRDPPLLLPPRPARGRQLPHVPGRDREDAEAADRLQHHASPTAWW